ncbi:hypothetical protein HWV62_12813 [Athelia sp. TMB]|nr:hypothetical protein HWV62_12813 [Athelia sp. TMB]
MLALLALLPALVIAQTTIYKPTRVTVTAILPTSSNGSSFESLSGNSTTWTPVTNTSTETNNLRFGPVGFRIAGDASSEVLYNFTSADVRWAIPEGGESTENDLEVVLNVTTSYAASNSGLKLTATPQVIPVTQTFIVQGLYCNWKENFTATISLENGTTKSITAFNELEFTLPSGAHNISLTQTDSSGLDSETVVYYGKGGLKASFPGGGVAPSIKAVATTYLHYCDDDD